MSLYWKYYLDNDWGSETPAKVAQVAKGDTDNPALPLNLAGLATLAAEEIAKRQDGNEGLT
jgi:hypothetical protein